MFDNNFMMNIPMGNDLLPPLPGEEALTQPVWPDSDAAMHDRILSSEQGIIGRDVQVQASELNSEMMMNGSMSMFSGLNLEAIFRTT